MWACAHVRMGPAKGVAKVPKAGRILAGQRSCMLKVSDYESRHMRLVQLCVALLLTAPSVAQNVIRFDDEGGAWYVADTYPQGDMENPNFIGTTTVRYFADGDSIVAGEAWGRLFMQPTTDPPPAAQFQGLVRQDGDVVLFLDAEAVMDTLYDFRLQPGDSMHYVSPWYDTYLPLLAVDSILVQGVYHRVFHFGQFFLTLEEALSDTWIEGIGSIHGPLAPRMPSTLGYNFGMPDSTRLTCYAQQGVTLWDHSGYPECVVNIALSLEEQADIGHQISIHPNPGSIFQLTGLGQQPAQLQLLDLQGRVLMEANTVVDHQPVDASGLPAGAYLLEVATDAGRQVLRWVKE